MRTVTVLVLAGLLGGCSAVHGQFGELLNGKLDASVTVQPEDAKEPLAHVGVKLDVAGSLSKLLSSLKGIVGLGEDEAAPVE